jgi:hypothetical protein
MKIPVFLNGDYQRPIGILELRDDVEVYEDAMFKYSYLKKRIERDDRLSPIQLQSLSLVYPKTQSKKE